MDLMNKNISFDFLGVCILQFLKENVGKSKKILNEKN